MTHGGLGLQVCRGCRIKGNHSKSMEAVPKPEVWNSLNFYFYAFILNFC
jgi:hypothetical protein